MVTSNISRCKQKETVCKTSPLSLSRNKKQIKQQRAHLDARCELLFYKLSLWREAVVVHGDKAPNVDGYFRQCNVHTIFS